MDVLFPPACVSCRLHGWPFCNRCLTEVGRLAPPGCARCGRPFEAPTETCVDCPPQPLALARAPFLYAGPVRRALMRLKFSGERSVAEALAPYMAAMLDRTLTGPTQEPPIITWVPLGRRRRRTRTFDQAEALARPVGELAGLS